MLKKTFFSDKQFWFGEEEETQACKTKCFVYFFLYKNHGRKIFDTKTKLNKLNFQSMVFAKDLRIGRLRYSHSKTVNFRIYLGFWFVNFFNVFAEEKKRNTS